MRVKQKKAMTPGALDRMIKRLDTLRSEGQDLAACLNQSEDNCWTDVYAVKERRAEARQSAPQLGKFGQATANNAANWLEGK
jgi:hypothetical protein